MKKCHICKLNIIFEVALHLNKWPKSPIDPINAVKDFQENLLDQQLVSLRFVFNVPKTHQGKLLT